jgi:asparagine synthase (glutamine-hydrolysing)
MSANPTRALRDILELRGAPAPSTAEFVAGELGGSAQTLAALAPALTPGRGQGLHYVGEAGVVYVADVAAELVGVFDLVRGDPAEALALDGEAWRQWRGRFVFARRERGSGDWLLVCDHFGSLPLYYSLSSAGLLISNRFKPLLRAPWCQRRPDPAAIFHYLNFACIPAPLTLVPEVQRLLPGSLLRIHSGASRAEQVRWWRPAYAEDLEGSDAQRAPELRERIVAAIQRYRPPGEDDWGCFLSGGTDSSSVVSVLARQHPGRAVHSYSIGFAEAEFDELDFARLAAQACGARGHFGSLDEAETLAVLPQLTALYDQPFGNASAVPTRACAGMAAAEGRQLLLAGDGGDEIFGGNERYAKDQIMQAFYRLPSPLKKLARGLGGALGGGNLRLFNRIDNFTRRASLPNPDRFYTDDAFASEHFDALLDKPLASALSPSLSLEFMRQTWDGCRAQAELHRLMALDLELAIAQNDLVKVDGACRHAGVGVRFPLLDPDLVEYTGRLPARFKVRRLDKRHLFKQAMAPILPAPILAKKKQGFGLPIAVWMKERPAFREFVRELLLSKRSQARGWFRPEFVGQLFERHQAGAWDYSAPLWQLAVLELWMRQNLDA